MSVHGRIVRLERARAMAHATRAYPSCRACDDGVRTIPVVIDEADEPSERPAEPIERPCPECGRNLAVKIYIHRIPLPVRPWMAA